MLNEMERLRPEDRMGLEFMDNSRRGGIGVPELWVEISGLSCKDGSPSFSLSLFFFKWHGMWDLRLYPCSGNYVSLHWKHRVFITGSPGKS